MFVLLRTLDNLRRDLGLKRPTQSGSLAVRHVDAGSCNGCEHELGAAANPYYDMARFGLSITASPRHADVLLITGPVTTRMRNALLMAYESMPEPRLVAALGDCALGCGLLGLANCHEAGVSNILPVDVKIPGCPPSPEVIARALISVMQTRAA
jgi:Ni,Fe-hydrogenase III small subunit